MKHILIILLVATIAIVALSGSASAAPSGYSYYKEHVIVGSPDGALTNHLINLTLYNTTGTDSGNVIYLGNTIHAQGIQTGPQKESIFKDVRVTNHDGSVVYPIWFQSGVYTNTKVIVWVNVTTTIPQSANTTIRIYYGNAEATPANDMYSTFPVADDFLTEINATNWTIGGSPMSMGRVAYLVPGDYIEHKSGFGTNYSVMWKAQYTTGAGTQWCGWDQTTGATDAALIDVIDQTYVNYGNGSVGDHAAHSVDMGSNRVCEVARSPGHTKFFIDGALKRDETTLVSSNTRKPIFYEYSATAMYVDWMAVRPCTTNEPTHGTTSEAYSEIPPVADFTSDVTGGWGTFVVTFTDTSTGSPTSWEWNFGDGSPNSTDQNPQHIYSTAGTFTVTLTATNAYGSDTEQKVGYIYAPTVLGASASFTTNVSSGYAPLCVQFTDTSTGDPATGWQWDFKYNTGYDSIQQNPAYTYTDPGVYSVRLVVTSANGTSGVTVTNLITVNEPPPTPTPKYVSPIGWPTVNPSYRPHALNTTWYNQTMNDTLNTNLSVLLSWNGISNLTRDLGAPMGKVLGGSERIIMLAMFVIFVTIWWRTKSVFAAGIAGLFSWVIVIQYIPREFVLPATFIIAVATTVVILMTLKSMRRD